MSKLVIANSLIYKSKSSYCSGRSRQQLAQCAKMRGQIFISYRREESSAWAGRLSDRLSNHFPSNQIFMDVDSVDLGEDFVKTIEKTVGSCDVLIAVIGKGWLISCDQEGQRRLDNPEDFVRIEIATALKRDIRVIPVLVDGASMPRSGDLPDDLKALVRRNALQLSHERFRTDSERLASAVERALEKTAAERREGEPQSQPPSPVAASPPPAKSKAANPSAETQKVVYPLPPKPAEPEREKPPPPSAGGTGGKSSSTLIAFLTIAAVLVVGGLIYLAFKASQSPPPQPAPVAAVTPSSPAIATPTVEEKALPTPEVAVQPSAQPTVPVAVAIPSPSISSTRTKEELARRALENATKDHPWVNSLGMKFVPVAGTRVLFSVWDTRVQDFETFVKSTGYNAGAHWHRYARGPIDPVVDVGWEDAKAFCEWLTKTEHDSGLLPNGSLYRLATDHEWSVAVGLTSEPGNTPEEKSGKIKVYPWGTQWPPPAGAGNYSGEERVKTGERSTMVIEGYKDGYPTTSPVGSFSANQFGLYDMGGNVWQWCEDRYDAEKLYRLSRGACWDNFFSDALLASFRSSNPPDFRKDDVGFRCVVAVESSR
jgi:hypothetical protein